MSTLFIKIFLKFTLFSKKQHPGSIHSHTAGMKILSEQYPIRLEIQPIGTYQAKLHAIP